MYTLLSLIYIDFFKEELFRVYNELEVLKKLVHQNICRMYQFYEDEYKCYFVMEVWL